MPPDCTRGRLRSWELIPRIPETSVSDRMNLKSRAAEIFHLGEALGRSKTAKYLSSIMPPGRSDEVYLLVLRI